MYKSKENSSSSMKVWKKTIRECRQGSLNVKDFCREKGISLRQYYYWLGKISKRYSHWLPSIESVKVKQTKEVSPLFLPLQMSESKLTGTVEPQAFVVELQSGHKILVPFTASLNSLINLVAALESTKC